MGENINDRCEDTGTDSFSETVFSPVRRRWFACLMAFALLILYSNTFQVPWVFDDDHNILERSSVHITDISPSSLVGALGGPLSPSLIVHGRPLSYLSFALNWLVGQDRVVGYHVVNLSIHFLNAFLLFVVTRQILVVSGMRSSRKIQGVSFLSAFLWAIHPIQIQSVTYIVQRMNALAALFYLLTLFFYLHGKLVYQKRFYFFSCLSLVCALASKENGILAVGALILLENVFFYKGYGIWGKRIVQGVNIVVLVVCLGVGLDYIFQWSSLYDAYELRSFTKSERWLTQFRIIPFYISQIVYPHPGRYSILHSFSTSQSLMDPITTLLGFLLVLGLLSVGWFLVKKGHKLLGFTILFFFLNHIMESTFIPLELVFEHRNYIPTFFFFLGLSLGIYQVLYDSRFSLFFRTFFSLSVIVLIFFIGYSTHERNRDWQTNRSLWFSAISHAPDMARVYLNLAATFDDMNTALVLNQKAQYLEGPTVEKAAYISYRNMAGIYYLRRDFGKAIGFLEKALLIHKDPGESIRLAWFYLNVESYKDAWRVLSNQPEDTIPSFKRPEYHRLKAIILIKQGELQKAKDETLAYLNNGGNISTFRMMCASIFVSLNESEKAAIYLKRCEKKFKMSLPNELIRVACARKESNDEAVDQAISQMVKGHRFEEVRQFLTNPSSLSLEPVSPELESLKDMIWKRVAFSDTGIQKYLSRP